MKALVYTGVETLEYLEVPKPTPKGDEVLIRVKASGICGSDMHGYLGHDERRPAPLILGHEVSGVIEGGEYGGKRVTVNPLVTCGSCRDCIQGRTNICSKRQIISMPPREGAFAEFVNMPFGNLVFVPDHVPFEKAALAEPIACGWHAVRLGHAVLNADLEKLRCLVIGGGAIGVGAALSLFAFGARNITLFEPNSIRRDRLFSMQEFNVIDPDDYDPTEHEGFEFVIDGVGYGGTRATASQLVRRGGVIAHIGLGNSKEGLDIRRMTLQEVTFFGTYAYTMEDFQNTAQAIFDGKLGALDWTEQRQLSAGQQAFKDIRAGSVTAPKIILV